MPDLKKIAEEADIIVNGYAFKKNNDEIRTFDLNNKSGAAVFNLKGELIETNMNDIELSIAQKYLLNNFSLLEL
jgi:hypothetical protein